MANLAIKNNNRSNSIYLFIFFLFNAEPKYSQHKSEPLEKKHYPTLALMSLYWIIGLLCIFS